MDVSEPHGRESPLTAPAGLHEQDDEETAPADDDDEIEEEIAPRPQPENIHTIEIERFLPAGQIDARYFEKPYYIVPREEISQESFAVIRDAMRREGVVGLARVVLSSRERHFLVEPMGNGLRGVTLRFAHEVRGADDYFSQIPQMKLPAEMMKLAQHIIQTKSDRFDRSMLEDHYRSALVRILRKKQPKVGPHAPAIKPSRENVVNLMDALRRSIAVERPANRRRGLGKQASSFRRTNFGRTSSSRTSSRRSASAKMSANCSSGICSSAICSAIANRRDKRLPAVRPFIPPHSIVTRYDRRRRKRKLSDYQRAEAIKRRAAGETLAQIAKSYGADISTILRSLI